MPVDARSSATRATSKLTGADAPAPHERLGVAGRLQVRRVNGGKRRWRVTRRGRRTPTGDQPTQARALSNSRCQGEHSPQSAGCQESCVVRNTRSGCGIMTSRARRRCSSPRRRAASRSGSRDSARPARRGYRRSAAPSASRRTPLAPVLTRTLRALRRAHDDRQTRPPSRAARPTGSRRSRRARRAPRIDPSGCARTAARARCPGSARLRAASIWQPLQTPSANASARAKNAANHRARALVIKDRLGPAFACAEHVAVREPAARRHAAKSSRPRGPTRCRSCARRCASKPARSNAAAISTLTVDALLAQHRDFRPRRRAMTALRHSFGSVEREPGMQSRIGRHRARVRMPRARIRGSSRSACIRNVSSDHCAAARRARRDRAPFPPPDRDVAVRSDARDDRVREPSRVREQRRDARQIRAAHLDHGAELLREEIRRPASAPGRRDRLEPDMRRKRHLGERREAARRPSGRDRRARARPRAARAAPRRTRRAAADRRDRVAPRRVAKALREARATEPLRAVREIDQHERRRCARGCELGRERAPHVATGANADTISDSGAVTDRACLPAPTRVRIDIESLPTGIAMPSAGQSSMPTARTIS